MQIKAILKALTDNSLVKVEKIGSGNYYWAFASDDKAGRERKMDGLKTKVDDLQKEITELESQIEIESVQRENMVRILIFDSHTVDI